MTIKRDILVIGAGPAGICVADELQRAGWSVAMIDAGSVGHSIGQFPTNLEFFSTRDLVELCGVPLTIPNAKPTRVEYWAYLHRVVEQRKLEVFPYHRVVTATRSEAGFELAMSSMQHGEVRASCRQLVLAIGAWERTNRLGVPGEDLPHVAHRYTEAFGYVGQRVLVVGGRNSAVETALELYRAGAKVAISYRGTTFRDRGIKYWLVPDIENRLERGEIVGFLGTDVVEILPNRVTMRRRDTGETFEQPVDFVMCLLGFRPTTELYDQLGVAYDPATLVPSFDRETLESNAPGVYLSGVILQGSMGGGIFIENVRDHAKKIREGMRYEV